MTRKQKIKGIIFREDIRNSAIIYKLFISNKLNRFIKKIKSKHILPNRKCLIKKGYITSEEQFIMILDYFITFFNEHFYFISCSDTETVISLLLKSKYCDEILLADFYKGDNSKGEYYINNFKKIIVDHFTSNLLKLYSGLDINLEEQCGIVIDNINIDNQRDIDKLFNLLIDIICCSNNIFDMYFLFESIDDYKKKLLYQSKNKQKVDNVALKYYNLKWNIHFTNYSEKIKYVRKLRVK